MISSHLFVSEEQKQEYKPEIKSSSCGYSQGSLQTLPYFRTNQITSFMFAVLGLSPQSLL